MRRVLLIGMFFLSGIIPGFGKPVTSQEIHAVVQSFIFSVFPSGSQYQISQISPVYNGTEISLYIVNLKPEGWMIISGDDKVTPVLGYSVTGLFDTVYPVDGEVGYWMNVYSRSVVSAMKDRKMGRNVLWNGEQSAYRLKSSAIAPIQPLIQVKWDQNNTWNSFCPADESGPAGHAYVGCVGVAMAQAMAYYHYPSKGTNSKTYYHNTYGTIIVHYDREPPYQWDSMGLDIPDKFNSLLLYHCAVSVGMDFGSDGSSAQTKNIPGALIKYFKYYSGVKYVARYVNDSLWTKLLISELSAKRPVIYSGYPEDNSPGHAFNIDGVDSRGYFHLNWGWNGKYNAYYLIDNLRPGTNNFTRDQGVVIGIRAPIARPTDLDLSKLTVSERMPAGTFVGKLRITDESTENHYVIHVKGDSVAENTYLPADFYVSHDSLKTSREFLYNEGNSYPIYIEVNDDFGNKYEEKFIISIVPNTVTGTSELPQEDGIEIYPNPSTGLLNIKNPLPGRFSVDMINQWGREIFHFESDGIQQILHFSHPVAGIYYLRIKPENGSTVVRKLVIID